MALLCVRGKIISYDNSENLPGCRMSGVERGSMNLKSDAQLGCLGLTERECTDPVLSW